jgi:hypothetical protein
MSRSTAANHAAIPCLTRPPTPLAQSLRVQKAVRSGSPARNCRVVAAANPVLPRPTPPHTNSPCLRVTCASIYARTVPMAGSAAGKVSNDQRRDRYSGTSSKRVSIEGRHVHHPGSWASSSTISSINVGSVTGKSWPTACACRAIASARARSSSNGRLSNRQAVGPRP